MVQTRRSKRFQTHQRLNLEQAAAPSSLQALPTDVILIVFKELLKLNGIHTLSISVPAVCKRFQTICRTCITIELDAPSLWAPVQLQSYNHGITDMGLMALASRFRGLRSLLIERPRNLDNVDGVLRTLATSPANCNALTDLHLKSCLLGDLGFESICSFSNLSTLDISDNTELFDYHLQEIVAACPLLTEISLAKCDELANVAPLARCSQLRHIDLRWNEHITDRVMGKIANGCPLLQSVMLTGCKRVTDQTLLHLARGCPELVDVEIMFLADTCTDAGVAALVRGCPKMHPNNIVTYLSVEGTMHGSDETNIKGDETLAAVGETRPNIASLCICNAPLITNTGINALIDGCKQLVSLTLQSCTSLVDAEFAAVVLGLPALAFNKFDTSSGIWQHDARGDEYLAAMATVYGATIASAMQLELFQFYHNCTDFGFSVFIQKCTTAVQSFDDVRQILNVDLSRGSMVGDMCVSAILDRFPTVTTLDFNFCTSMTDGGLAKIAELCGETLSAIDLSNCSSITAAGVATLIRSCCNILPCNIKQINDTWHDDSLVMGKYKVLLALSETYGATLTAAQMITSSTAPRWFLQVEDAGMAELIGRCTTLFPTAASVRHFCNKAYMGSHQGYYSPPAAANMHRSVVKCIGDKSVAAIAKRFPKLTELNLSHCTDVTDAGLRSVADGCKLLERINLTKCGDGGNGCGGTDRRGGRGGRRGRGDRSGRGNGSGGVTSFGIASIIHGCRKVASFGPQGVQCSTTLLKADVVVAAIATQHPTLDEAELNNVHGWITGISEVGLATLVANCTTLFPTYASVRSFCVVHRLLKRIDDTVLVAIVGRFGCADGSTDHGSRAGLGEKTSSTTRQLTSLDLSNCTSISDAGLRAVASNCAGLLTIDLTGTSSNLVTDKGIAALLKKKACPLLHPDQIKCDKEEVVNCGGSSGSSGGGGMDSSGSKRAGWLEGRVAQKSRKSSMLFQIFAEERCRNLKLTRESNSSKHGIQAGEPIHCSVQ